MPKTIKRTHKRKGKSLKPRKRVRHRKQTRFSKHHQFVNRIFHTGNIKERRKLIRSASKSEILTLVEFVYNILKRNIPLTSNQKLALCRYKKQLNLLSNRKIPCESKRKVFLKTGKQSEQSGGFLGLL